MYNRRTGWSSIFLVVIILILYSCVLIYIWNRLPPKPVSPSLKLIYLPLKGGKHKDLIRNVLNRFNNVFILSGMYKKDKKDQSDQVKEKKEPFFFVNDDPLPLPFISPNLLSPGMSDVIPVGGFKSVISQEGDYTFINSRLNEVSWNSSDPFILDRTTFKTFLKDRPFVNGDKKHYLFFNLTRYYFKGNKAVHVNYITRKAGMSNSSTKAFIQFLNWFKSFTQTNNIFYFTISGTNNIRSAKWLKVVKKILKDSCFVSPGIESKFITDEGDRYGARTSRFIIISKPMAPNGVYFYLTQEEGDHFSSGNILVAEILNSSSSYKSPLDETEIIFNNYVRERHINPGLKIDLETSNDVNLAEYDLEEKGDYISFNGMEVV